MKITLNGEAVEMKGPLTIAALVATLGVEPRKIAVEQNRTIVPKSLYASTSVSEGDIVELVQFVGGG